MQGRMDRIPISRKCETADSARNTHGHRQAFLCYEKYTGYKYAQLRTRRTYRRDDDEIHFQRYNNKNAPYISKIIKPNLGDGCVQLVRAKNMIPSEVMTKETKFNLCVNIGNVVYDEINEIYKKSRFNDNEEKVWKEFKAVSYYYFYDIKEYKNIKIQLQNVIRDLTEAFRGKEGTPKDNYKGEIFMSINAAQAKVMNSINDMTYCLVELFNT